MVLIDTDGKIQLCKAFDTSEFFHNFDKFIIKDLPDGYIIVAVCKDDCVSAMSHSGKEWFRQMGSNEIQNLEP